MCNPPFYSSVADLALSASQKSRPPNSACTGAPIEMVCPGGEIAFVSRLISESLKHGERVQWYSSMLGKLSSVGVLVEQLRQAKITNYAVTEFVQGSKTRRWAIAWSFGDYRPTVLVARGIGSLEKRLLPFPSYYQVDTNNSMEMAAQRLNDTLSALDLQWHWKPRLAAGVGFAAKNVWSRASRRRSEKVAEMSDDEEDEMAFVFKISLIPRAGEPGGIEVVIRWMKGNDSVVFESFCGMIKRKLDA